MPVSVEDFFGRLVAALERIGVPYMVTGSFASTAHGRARATYDIDVIIAPSMEQLRALMAEFPDDRYYADEEDAIESFRHLSQFNIIDFASTWKADLIFRKDREFSRVEFSRRQRQTIAGTPVYVATAEDVLIAKLEWAKMGESERQIEDAAGIIATQGEKLDVAYVRQWVRQLALDVQWEKAQRRAVA
jgi:hypothetical protein